MNSMTIAMGVVGVLITFVAVVLAIAATKPNSFRIERTAKIRATPDSIFSLINNFRCWEHWSPWEKLDPSMRKTFQGAEQGVGAIYTWNGNKKVGEGRMEIFAAESPTQVAIRLSFVRPFPCENTVEFQLVPVGDQTSVTWAMNGQNLFMGKVMAVFMNMDKMIGKDFETGLANLKATAEKSTS